MILFSRKARNRVSWIIATIISSIAFAAIPLLLKQLTQYSISPEIINFYFWLSTSITFLAFSLYKKAPFTIAKESFVWFFLLAIIAFVANYFSVVALQIAPNPGYVRAIQAANIILVTILSIFIFRSPVTIKTIFGIIIILAGVYLLTF